MYTTIIDETEGRAVEYQIHTGEDNFATYKVGDPVERYVDAREPGYGALFDGVYDGTPVDAGRPNRWVVIKDQKVLCLHDRATPGVIEPYEWEMLLLHYKIEPPRFEWWSDAAWAARAIKEFENEQRARRESGEYFRKTPIEILMMSTGRHLRTVLKEESFMRSIMPPLNMDVQVSVEEVSRGFMEALDQHHAG
jgi:hypothetical protein